MNNEIPQLPKINEEQVNNENMFKEAKESIIKESHSLVEFLKDAYKYITSKNTSELFELLLRLVLIAAFVIVLYVPIQLIRDLGVDLLISMGVSFTDKMLNLYNSIWNIFYTIIAIILFINLCKDRYYKLVKNQKIEKDISDEQKNSWNHHFFLVKTPIL